MTQNSPHLKLDIAVARALLDELERTKTQPDGRVVAQLVEELSRVASDLDGASRAPSSG